MPWRQRFYRCPGGNDSIDTDLDLIPDYCDDSINSVNESNIEKENNSEENSSSNDSTQTKSIISTTDYIYIASVVSIIVGSMIFLYRNKK